LNHLNNTWYAALAAGCPVDSKKPDSSKSEKGSFKDGEGRETPFPYEQFWSDRIEAKKKDHTYRVFRNVERNAQTFPLAKVGND